MVVVAVVVVVGVIRVVVVVVATATVAAVTAEVVVVFVVAAVLILDSKPGSKAKRRRPLGQPGAHGSFDFRVSWFAVRGSRVRVQGVG